MPHIFIKAVVKEHQSLRKLLRGLVSAREEERRVELLKSLRRELLPHLLGEEASLYACLLKNGDRKARTCARAALEEHELIRRLVGELRDEDPRSEKFPSRALVLQRLYETHVQQEEGVCFEDLKRTYCDEDIKRMLQAFRAMRERGLEEISSRA